MFAFDIAPGDRIVGLQRLEPDIAGSGAHSECRGDLSGSPIGHTDITDQPFADEVVQRSQALNVVKQLFDCASCTVAFAKDLAKLVIVTANNLI